MGTTVEDRIEELDRHAKSLRAVMKKYPDAVFHDLPDGQRALVSAMLGMEIVDGGQPARTRAMADSKGTVHLVLYVEVAGSFVFVPWGMWLHANAVLDQKGSHMSEDAVAYFRSLSRR